MLPSLVASVAASLCYNFFFLPPIYTFTITDPTNVAAFVTFTVVAVIVSNIAARMRSQAVIAATRASTTEALYAFSRKLAGTGTLDDVLWATAFQIASMLKVRVVLLLPEDGWIAVKAGYPPEDTLDQSDLAAANWAWHNDRAAGRGADTLPGAQRLFLPMRTGRSTVGVVGIDSDKPGPLLTPDQRRLFDALIDQAALAIERVHLAEDVDRAKRTAETERLRAALLTSLSHDLRTPLSAILGAASALRELADRLSAEERADLLSTIVDESERLNRFIANLLDMTKLEAGAVAPKSALHDPADIVSTALKRASKILAQHTIETELQPGLPMVQVDPVLLEQVLFNLLDNAAKYAPAGTPIRVEGWKDRKPFICRLSMKGPVFRLAISSASSTSSTGCKRVTTCEPERAWGSRSREGSWRRWTARLRPPIARTAPAPSSRSDYRCRRRANWWIPPNECRSDQSPGGRRRAADPQALADGTLGPRL